jgi:hypothetical protein
LIACVRSSLRQRATGFAPITQIAFQPLTAQENAISSRLDIKQFQDPKFVEKFVQRYLIANSANTSSSSSATPDLMTLAVQAQGIFV